jgi:hypothetical protein
MRTARLARDLFDVGHGAFFEAAANECCLSRETEENGENGENEKQ